MSSTGPVRVDVAAVTDHAYLQALGSAGVVMWTCGVEVGGELVTPGWPESLGYSPESVGTCHDCWLKLMPAPDRAAWEAVRKQVEEGRIETGCSEYRVRAADGSFRWYRGSVRRGPPQGGKGSPRLIEVAVDITAEKIAEQRGERDRAGYEAMFGSVHQAAFVMDRERFVDCNATATAMFRCDREQIIGSAPWTLSPELQRDGERSREASIKRIEAALEGEPQVFEWTSRRADGTDFLAEVSLRRIDGVGRPLLVASVLDLDERVLISGVLSAGQEAERVILELATRLTSVATDRVDIEIKRGLEAVGRLLDVDEAHLFRISADRSTMGLTHLWRTEGTAPDLERLSGLPIDEHTWHGRRILGGRIASAADLDDLPQDAQDVKGLIASTGIRAFLDVPMSFRGVVTGFIGAGRIVPGRAWTTAESTLLDIAGQIMTAAIERTRTEGALRESERMVRAMAEQTFHMLCLLSPDGRVLFANEAAARASAQSGGGAEPGGGPETEVIGSRFVDAPWWPVDEAGGARLCESIERAGAGEFVRYQTAGFGPQGEPLVLDVSFKPARDASGEVAYTILEGRDISEMRRAQDELKRTQALLGAAIEASPAGIIIADAPDVRIRLANAAAGGILSVPNADLVGIVAEPSNNIWETYRPDGAAFTHDDLPIARAVLNGDTPHNEWMLIRRSDGEERWINANAAPVRDESGNVTAGVVVFLDMTEQRLAEESLRLTQHTIDTSHSPVLRVRADGSILYANEAVCRALGYSMGEILKKTVADLDAFWSHEDFLRIADETRRRGALTVETSHLRKDGERLTAEVTLDHVEYRGGEHFFLFMTDVTERAVLQERLRHAARLEAVGRLAGGIAHDLNNMLVPILHATSDGLEGADLPQATRSLLDVAHQAAGNARDMTQRLLAFAVRQPAKPELIDLNGALAESERLYRHLVAQNVEVRFDYHADAGVVRIDRSQLQQVLLNLVVNARDAMPDGGRLLVETDTADLDGVSAKALGTIRSGRYAVLRVSDTGAGMDEATRERIFEPFFTTKTVGQGAGLGLSTVYGIVRQNRGVVTCSSAPGAGSVFAVYLPVADVPSRSKAETSNGARSADAPPAQVLLVEDDPMVRAVTESVLRGADYVISSFADPLEALDHARGEAPIDLLVTDVVMPHMTGRELSDAVSELRPSVRTLFVSGFARDLVADRADLEPDAVLLHKPFTASELRDAVKAALAAQA